MEIFSNIKIEQFIHSHDWGRATGISWVEAWDNARRLTIHRALPQQRMPWPQMSMWPRLKNCALDKDMSAHTHKTLSTVPGASWTSWSLWIDLLWVNSLRTKLSAGRFCVQLTLEEYRFELHWFIYTQTFFNKYVQYNKCIFLSYDFWNYVFSSLVYCKNRVYNIYSMQSMC